MIVFPHAESDRQNAPPTLSTPTVFSPLLIVIRAEGDIPEKFVSFCLSFPIYCLGFGQRCARRPHRPRGYQHLRAQAGHLRELRIRRTQA